MLGTLIYLKHIHVRIDNICQNHCLVHTTYLFSDFSICLNTVDLLIDLAIVLTGMKTRMGLFGQLKCICVLCVSQIVGWMSISSALRWCPMTANRTWSTWRRFTAVISPRSSRLITLNDPWWWTCAYERSNHEVTRDSDVTLFYIRKTFHKCCCIWARAWLATPLNTTHDYLSFYCIRDAAKHYMYCITDSSNVLFLRFEVGGSLSNLWVQWLNWRCEVILWQRWVVFCLIVYSTYPSQPHIPKHTHAYMRVCV